MPEPRIPVARPDTASLLIRVHDGSRELFPSGIPVLYRVIDGNNKTRFADSYRLSAVRLRDLPVSGDQGDSYRVIVSASGYMDAGLFPVRVEANREVAVELLLVPQSGVYGFARVRWPDLAAIDPRVPAILSSDLSEEDAAAARWQDLFERDALAAACLLNVLTIMAKTSIASGQQFLGFLKQIIWDENMGPDRCFGWAERPLLECLQQPPATADQIKFVPQAVSLHPSATRKFKARQYTEANLEIAFHENAAPPPGHPDWAKVELDVDYSEDIAAHSFLEVIPRSLTSSVIDPAHVMALRWMAERRAGRDFDPLYTVQPA